MQIYSLVYILICMKYRDEANIPWIILRVIVVAIITYGFLYFLSDHNVPHNHDRWKTTYYNKAKVNNEAIVQNITWWSHDDEELETNVNMILSDAHESANIESSYEKLCNIYPDYCGITSFDSNKISNKQKLYYQTLVIYALKKFKSYGIDFSDYIGSIVIKFENTKSRGYSSRTQMVLNIRPMGSYFEFINVFIHELGHFVDFSHLVWDLSLPKDTTFTEFGRVVFPVDDPSVDFYKLNRLNENTRKKWITYKDFVSGYAMTDPFETLAETMHFYINYNSIFRELVKQSPVLWEQFQFMDELFWGQYISDGLKKKWEFEKYDRDFRPYDTTRF